MEPATRILMQQIEDEEPIVLWETYARDDLPLRSSAVKTAEPGVYFVYEGTHRMKDFDGEMMPLPVFSIDLVIPTGTAYAVLCSLDAEGTVEVILNMSIPDHVQGRGRVPRRFLGPSDGWGAQTHPDYVDFLLIFFGEGVDDDMLEAFMEFDDEIDEDFLFDAFAWALQDPEAEVLVYRADTADVFAFSRRLR